MFPRNWLSVIVIPIVVALVLYFVILPGTENESRSKAKQQLVGNWENESRNILITFEDDGTYQAINNNTIYDGKWEITNTMFHYVRLNWEGYNTEYMYMIYQEELSLIGVNEPAGVVYLTKSD
jgi:hypothetical protein